MKVMFAIKALNDAKGGAERVLADVTSCLSSKGYDISVLSFDKQGGQSFYPLNDNIKRVCLGIGNTRKKSNILETLMRMKALRQKVNEENPDVVVAFMHSMFVPMAFALIGTGVPVIASEHIVPKHYRERKFEFLLLLISSLFVKRITVLSQSIKKSYPKLLSNKIITISNPVNKPDVLSDSAGLNDKIKIILNVGRLDPQKDQKTLIYAFSIIAGDYPEWNLRIMGDGELREELEALVKNLELEGRVFLAGTTNDISSEYKEAHIFALSSIYESFGLATAEAMAHGLPPIGFADCQGTNELIVNDVNGLLISSDNRVKAMADAIEILINAPDMRVKYGSKACKDVEKYQITGVVNDWQVLLKRYARV